MCIKNFYKNNFIHNSFVDDSFFDIEMNNKMI